jgi:hypothetical protein
VVAYGPDTGYCNNAVKTGRHEDLLIAECAYRIGETDTSWPHLNPEWAARIAREAGAKNLVLVHFDASRYKTLGDRKKAAMHARTAFSNTVSDVDGLIVDVWLSEKDLVIFSIYDFVFLRRRGTSTVQKSFEMCRNKKQYLSYIS